MLSRLVYYIAACCGILIPGVAEGQFQGGGSDVGYISPAPIRDRVRLRFDTAFNFESPDRAAFFFPQEAEVGNPDGPPRTEASVDYNEIRVYLEKTVGPDFSVFFETPYRGVNPDINANTSGWSDLSVGARLSLLRARRHELTLQFRTEIPTGVARRGLGTGHTSLEPGLLFQYHVSDNLRIETEIRDWIPVSGSGRWNGNVLRYGVGAVFATHDLVILQLTPLVEFVGWSVLDGRAAFAGSVPFDADATIVAAKYGFRLRRGSSDGRYGTDSLYIGTGHALTSTHWYENVVRIAYRYDF